MRASLIFAGLVFGAMSASPALGQSAGVIQFVAGDVSLVRPGASERSARKGVVVNVGDTLTTANGGLAQLKMGDGAIVVVAPESRVTVAEFHYAGVEDGTEKVRYRLEQGGFRAVTGAIGRTHKDNYLIETPIAHMGVRGTDHETYYFPTTGPGNGDGAKPGAYNKVNTGRTFIRTGAGELEIEPNQVGFVASANDVPVILPAVPGFFNRSVAPRNARAKEAPASESASALAPAQEEKITQIVSATDGTDFTAPDPGVSAGPGSVVAWAEKEKKQRIGFSGAELSIEPKKAKLVRAGGDPAFQVNWGSWQGGKVTVAGQDTVAVTHFAQSGLVTSQDQLNALSPKLVTATYSYAGGPTPTNQSGRLGEINSLVVTVDFAKQAVTGYALDASVGKAQWNVNGSGSFGQFTGASGIALDGRCSGCAPAVVDAKGTAHGLFVGAAAEKMITSFGLTTPAKDALTGAAYLSR